VVRRNHFHDGFSRMGLLKAFNLTYTDNLVERAGGVHMCGFGVNPSACAMQCASLAPRPCVCKSNDERHMRTSTHTDSNMQPTHTPAG